MDAPKVSASFPEGDGDLCLVSTDGILFYVHSQLLRHSSAVFATMLDIGSGAKKEGNCNDPVRMEADAVNLELLLLYVYPLRKNPRLSTLERISTLLSLSHRYELPGVTQQLRTALTETRVAGDSLTLPLYKTSPMMALAIADAYDLVPEARLALHDCLNLHQSDLLSISANINVPVRILTLVLTLRQQRIDWFASKLDSLDWSANAFPYLNPASEKSKIERAFNKRPDLYALKDKMLSVSDACIPAGDLQVWEKEWSHLYDKIPVFPSK